MNGVRKVTEDLYWVGVNDKRIELFENIHPIPEGVSYNSYLILDEKTGRPLNGNLLDYKLMTMLDTPDIKADFVELCDPMGPYGNKALGEPPAIPCAPAIRNAVLHATGVAFYENPLTPQRLIDGFQKAGLI